MGPLLVPRPVYGQARIDARPHPPRTHFLPISRLERDAGQRLGRN